MSNTRSSDPALHGALVDAGADASARFVRALLAGDRTEALAIVKSELALGVAHVYERVVRTALERIGELWARDEITVADEHVASAIAQSAIAALYPSFHWPIGGPRAIIACVEGERHEIGARMVADLLALDGWNTTFAGADLPREVLVEMAATMKPVFVGLSVTLGHHAEEARLTIAALRDGAPSIRILAGGRMISRLAGHGDGLGADQIAYSGTGAVDAARAWKLGAP